MENLSEQDLENYIMTKQGNDDARYVLAKLMIEGTSDKV